MKKYKLTGNYYFKQSFLGQILYVEILTNNTSFKYYKKANNEDVAEFQLLYKP